MGTVLLGVSYAVVRHEFRDEQGKVHVAVEELTPVKSGAPTIRVKIAPGIPPENTNPVRTLSAASKSRFDEAVDMQCERSTQLRSRREDRRAHECTP